METDLQLILNVLSAICETDSIEKKKAIILANRTDVVLSTVIMYIAQQDSFGVTLESIEKPPYHIIEPKQCESLMNLLYSFRNHGNADNVLEAYYFVRRKPKEERTEWKKIICRDYNIGLDSKTVSKLIISGE